MRKKIEKNFWDMEIIGNRRKRVFVHLFSHNQLVPRDFIQKFMLEMSGIEKFLWGFKIVNS